MQQHERGRHPNCPGNGLGPRRRSSACATRSGLTLIEVAITLSILVAAVLGFSQALVDSMVTTRVNRQLSLATDGARRILSDLQGVEFDQVFARYNSDQNANLLGTTPILNGGFTIAGLDPAPGDADGLVGRLLFPEGGVAGAIELREDSADARFGTPRDLDGDGVAGDALDHSGDYRLLPVVVQVDWNGAAGPAHLEFKTVLARY
jgi:hypothetical protein